MHTITWEKEKLKGKEKEKQHRQKEEDFTYGAVELCVFLLFCDFQ